MTSTIVKPCDYDLEKLTFNPLLSTKQKTLKQFYYPPTMVPEAL